MSELVPQPWEIWHARFDFSEGHGYKYRPVIVLATRPDGSLVAMVTGAANKLSLAHDYAIREWEAAGLDRPSIARLDRIAEIPAGYLGTAGRIGRLADGDIAAIKTILAEITRYRDVIDLIVAMQPIPVRPRTAARLRQRAHSCSSLSQPFLLRCEASRDAA